MSTTEFLTRSFLESGRRHGESERIDWERLAFARAVLESLGRASEKRSVSREFLQNAVCLITRTMVGTQRDPARERFRDRFGVEPPWLLAVAPTGACNLECEGCYAGSTADCTSIDFALLERIVDEARRLWGIKVLVLVGGEPFLYESESKGILDLVEENPDLLFLVFTNGTLIDRATARRLASLGNAFVALSVEGLKDSTDARRGAGTFHGVATAMLELQSAGALFGLSMTATSNNAEELMSDGLQDFFFVKNSAFFAFVFQYMPEGRDPDTALMVTSEQRLWMWERSWDVIEKQKIFLFDFWNHGALVGGCLAAGREHVYLYVDWECNVMPCVFAPYSGSNLRDVYASGGTLDDAWASPFIGEIRAWQKRHASCDGSLTSGGVGASMMCACPVRDHYADFREMVLHARAVPARASAGACLTDPGFVDEMIRSGRDFAELGRPVLDAEYGSAAAARGHT